MHRLLRCRATLYFGFASQSLTRMTQCDLDSLSVPPLSAKNRRITVTGITGKMNVTELYAIMGDVSKAYK